MCSFCFGSFYIFICIVMSRKAYTVKFTYKSDWTIICTETSQIVPFAVWKYLNIIFYPEFIIRFSVTPVGICDRTAFHIFPCTLFRNVGNTYPCFFFWSFIYSWKNKGIFLCVVRYSKITAFGFANFLCCLPINSIFKEPVFVSVVVFFIYGCILWSISIFVFTDKRRTMRIIRIVPFTIMPGFREIYF